MTKLWLPLILILTNDPAWCRQVKSVMASTRESLAFRPAPPSAPTMQTQSASGSTSFGPVTSWDFLLNVDVDSNGNAALVNHVTGGCDAKMNGRDTKSKPGRLSHVTLDAMETEKSVIDRLKAENVKPICYINVGAIENDRDGKYIAALRSAGAVGGKMKGWDKEQWLSKGDVPAVVNYVREKIKICKDKGFSAIDMDNIQSDSESGGMPLEENIKFVNMLNRECGSSGLPCGWKNALDLLNNPKVQHDNFQFGVAECGASGCTDLRGKFKDVLTIRYGGGGRGGGAKVTKVSSGPSSSAGGEVAIARDDEAMNTLKTAIRQCGRSAPEVQTASVSESAASR